MQRMAWEVVWMGEGEVAAQIVAGRLEAEGLRTRIRGSSLPARWGGGPTAGGDWAVAVPGASAAEARAILRERDDPNVFEGADHVAENVRLMVRIAPWAVIAVLVLLIVGALQSA